ncbi:hypothetical protein AC1031_017154 [Aphanomyces cochlioides]|nr:hypothetical protein AC1031_017154 [Aphanomyces cochlioides]
MDAVRQEDTKTRAALKLIADNHEQRAMRWHMLVNLRQSPPSSTDNSSAPHPSQTDLPTPPPSSTSSSSPPLTGKTNKASLSSRTSDVHMDYNQPLQTAASEMEELFDRLQALGFSTAASNPAFPPSAPPQLKQYLSSDLGDSFYLLPKAHGKPASPLTACRVDGEAMLRAGVAQRMKNQRERLMEKQAMRPSSLKEEDNEQAQSETSNARRSHGDSDLAELDQLKSALAHQKYEATRLMQTVKTLSAENAKLIQDTQDMARLREENKRLVHAMDDFKTEYQQKFAVLKRALEEWRRRQNEQRTSPQEATDKRMTEQQVLLLQHELSAAQEAIRQKDTQLKRYESWFQSLKASAKAKQQSRDAPLDQTSNTSSNSPMHAPLDHSTRREL